MAFAIKTAHLAMGVQNFPVAFVFLAIGDFNACLKIWIFFYFLQTMRHGEEIIKKLLRVKKAEKLAESVSDRELCDKISDYIFELEREIPPLVLSHVRRLEAAGRAGFAEVLDGKCAACGEVLPEDELEFIKNENIGVCERCFAFLYYPGFDTQDDDAWEQKILSS